MSLPCHACCFLLTAGTAFCYSLYIRIYGYIDEIKREQQERQRTRMTEQGKHEQQNPVENVVSRVMGGHTAKGDAHPTIVVGQEYGRTPYSGEPEKLYEATRGTRQTLDASDYFVVTQGYLREWVCMGQCNLFIQVLRNPMLRQSMETYQHDVYEPNLTELRTLLEAGGYALPAPYNAVHDARSVESLRHLETDAIDDRMLLLGHIFSVEPFMNRWNEGARLSHRAEVRDAFLHNYHRANRWHLASIAMAEKMQFLEPQPHISR